MLSRRLDGRSRAMPGKCQLLLIRIGQLQGSLMLIKGQIFLREWYENRYFSRTPSLYSTECTIQAPGFSVRILL